MIHVIAPTWLMLTYSHGRDLCSVPAVSLSCPTDLNIGSLEQTGLTGPGEQSCQPPTPIP